MYVRLINRADSKDVFDWRNDSQTRLNSIDTSSVNLEQHQAWFDNSLNNPDRVMLMGQQKNQKIGICRFDICRSTGVATVSINLNPAFRGQKLAFPLLKSGLDFMREHYPLTSFSAQVKAHNTASKAIFEKAGFTCKSNNEDTLAYSLSLN
ncbi:GNAT family N-acetyltransferase [Glaciecola sp. 1036]|uniref:GNAT family N-acetyltransferase n=1 Tax=Alteromonadaceae TaxID=72275 RepID=UPI003D059297